MRVCGPGRPPEGRRTRDELADARLGHALADLLVLVLVVDPDCRGGVDVSVGDRV